MRTITADVTVRDLAGVAQLELTPANGYTVTLSPDEGEEVWESEEDKAPWVDGSTVGMERLACVVMPLSVRISGSSWAQVEQRRIALRNATATPAWLLEYAVEGVVTTWRTNGRPDRSSSFTTSDVANRRRTVLMRVRVQPTPTVTGV